MEQLLETVTLDVEEVNELAFKIQVEGATSPAKVRLVCEGADFSYMFMGKGTGEDGVVQFIIPQMKNKLQEGTYSARVEVLIDNRYFSPVQFNLNFKKTMQVFAEAVNVVHKSAKPDIKVTASPIVISSSRPEPRPPVVQPTAQPVKQATVAQVTTESSLAAKKSASTLREKFSKVAQGATDNDLRKLAKLLASVSED